MYILSGSYFASVGLFTLEFYQTFTPGGGRLRLELGARPGWPVERVTPGSQEGISNLSSRVQGSLNLCNLGPRPPPEGIKRPF